MEYVEGKIEEYQVCPTILRNILMIGDSRAGKTTFIRNIIDINHSVDNEIYRGTISPESISLTINANNRLITLNFIDTPGLNEFANDDSRNNNTIFESITSFVKKDVTKIHLVLITINASNGINNNHLIGFKDIIMTLGKDFKPNLCLLLTNYENYGDPQEAKFMQEFSTSPHLKIFNISCGAGVLFSGAMTKEQYSTVSVRDQMIIKQRKRILKFINKVSNAEPTIMTAEKISEITSRLKLHESIITDYRSAVKMGKEIKVMRSEALEKRLSLSSRIKLIKDAKLKERCERIVEFSSKIGSPQDYKDDLSDIAQVRLVDYIKESTEVSEKIRVMREYHDELSKLRSDLEHAMIEAEFE